MSRRDGDVPQGIAEERDEVSGASLRRALARVNVGAIERNCERLRSELRAGCELCAVVKADGYGHGAVQSARAALRGGATRLAVAGSSEARALRDAGLQEIPLLVMGALSPVELREALDADAEVVVWSEQQLAAVARAGGGRVHVKLDTGMGRLGTRDPQRALSVVREAASTPGIELVGAMTHFATADGHGGDRRESHLREHDERQLSFFEHQLELFEQWAGQVKALHPHAIVHAANSAAVLREPRSHFDMVRCGIAVYGMDPFGEDPLERGLEPALELCSYVAEVKRCAPGESAGYGRNFVAERPTWLAVLPIGYGDGWRRGLSNNGEALIGGARRRLVGTVSMDNLTVELGEHALDKHPPGEHAPREHPPGEPPGVEGVRGSEAVLLGARGSGPGADRITAEQVARRLGTINYEITCGLTQRVPRVYYRDGVPLQEGEAVLAPPAAPGAPPAAPGAPPAARGAPPAAPGRS